jgi:hypothetical protein
LRQIKDLKESRFGQIEFLNLKNQPLIYVRSYCIRQQGGKLYGRRQLPFVCLFKFFLILSRQSEMQNIYRKLKMKELDNPKNVRFKELLQICIKHFGEPRISGSHHIFKTVWQGDPRINIQKDGNMAKPYQVKIVKKALEKLEQEAKDEKR